MQSCTAQPSAARFVQAATLAPRTAPASAHAAPAAHGPAGEASRHTPAAEAAKKEVIQ
jgi:hypothetical protein